MAALRVNVLPPRDQLSLTGWPQRQVIKTPAWGAIEALSRAAQPSASEGPISPARI
jgi:hypothetical protein